MDKPEFERTADRTIEEVQKTYQQRGGEYADSWALSNVHAPFLSLVLREIVDTIVSPEVLRLILMASLIDVKDSRMIGPWKQDTVIDGIAYRSAFTQFMEEYQCGLKSPSSREAEMQNYLSPEPEQPVVSPTTRKLPENAHVLKTRNRGYGGR